MSAATTGSAEATFNAKLLDAISTSAAYHMLNTYQTHFDNSLEGDAKVFGKEITKCLCPSTGPTDPGGAARQAYLTGLKSLKSRISERFLDKPLSMVNLVQFTDVLDPTIELFSTMTECDSTGGYSPTGINTLLEHAVNDLRATRFGKTRSIKEDWGQWRAEGPVAKSAYLSRLLRGYEPTEGDSIGRKSVWTDCARLGSMIQQVK